jgi:hypothetical protein
MLLTPKNRHIQVEETKTLVEDEKSFVLPDSYKPPAKEYECYRVIAQAEDCNHTYPPGALIAVERHMIKSLDYAGTKYLLILENYVLASFT